MSTDRELLELAAKAAGMDVHLTLPADGWTRDEWGDYSVPWNPRTDDCDAFRLAVTLRLDIEHGNEALAVNGCKVAYGDDPFAATRLAIVLCAAEIGRSLP